MSLGKGTENTMKKTQMISLCIVILFAIDFSMSQLLGFSLLYERIHDTDILCKVYAFIIGISAFYSILLIGNRNDWKQKR